MSFLKKLFGGSRGGAEAAAPAPMLEHKGFTIRATPFVEAGQHQLCGVIEKELDGELKSQRFIRADRFASAEEACDAALRKGQQIVDEQGDRVFG